MGFKVPRGNWIQIYESSKASTTNLPQTIAWVPKNNNNNNNNVWYLEIMKTQYRKGNK